MEIVKAKINLKKVLCILFATAMLFSAQGCVDESEPKKENYESSEISSEAEKKQTFGLNETAVFENLKITATELKETSGTEFYKPESGNTFAGVKFTIENISDEEQTVSSLLLFDAYADDVSCDYSISAQLAFDGDLDGTLAPGKKLIGWYGVEVPENWSNLEFQIKSEWLSSVSATFVFNK